MSQTRCLSRRHAFTGYFSFKIKPCSQQQVNIKKNVLNFAQNDRCLFIFHHFCCQYKYKHSLHLLQLILTSLFYLTAFQEKDPYNLHQHSLPLYLIHFSLPLFYIQPLLQLPSKNYPYLSQSTSSGCVKSSMKQRVAVRADNIFISSIKHGNAWQRSNSLIHYCLSSENWCCR